jgi:hypothetical protein
MAFWVCGAFVALPRIEGASEPEWLDETEAASEHVRDNLIAPSP